VSELGSYDVVAFTSENGVVKFFDAVAAAGRDARAFGHCLVAAIGEGTARALLARGVIADVVPGSFRGEALAEAILGEADPSAAQAVRPRVLIPRALVAREVLPDTLRAGGCEVDVVPVYETRAAGAERRAELLSMLEDRQIDIVLLASSSTVDSLCDLLGPRAVELMAGVIVASIGEITTTTAGRRGLRVDVTAEKSTLRGLVDAVEVFCSAASRTIV
jgi:uroporphyrinogen III methyltransferase/synthase